MLDAVEAGGDDHVGLGRTAVGRCGPQPPSRAGHCRRLLRRDRPRCAPPQLPRFRAPPRPAATHPRRSGAGGVSAATQRVWLVSEDGVRSIRGSCRAGRCRAGCTPSRSRCRRARCRCIHGALARGRAWPSLLDTVRRGSTPVSRSGQLAPSGGSGCAPASETHQDVGLRRCRHTGGRRRLSDPRSAARSEVP
jgi:hypothetical protein